MNSFQRRLILILRQLATRKCPILQSCAQRSFELMGWLNSLFTRPHYQPLFGKGSSPGSSPKPLFGGNVDRSRESDRRITDWHECFCISAGSTDCADVMHSLEKVNICICKKRMELIDAGLMFNSPYPPLLRKQRSVDLIPSFDFSARETDEERP